MIEPPRPASIIRLATVWAHEEGRADVEPENGVIILGRDVDEGRGPVRSGIVDQDIEGRRRPEDVGTARAVVDVESDRLGNAAPAADLGDCGLDFGRGPADQGYGGARFG